MLSTCVENYVDNIKVLICCNIQKLSTIVKKQLLITFHGVRHLKEVNGGMKASSICSIVYFSLVPLMAMMSKRYSWG